ncbi:MAG: MBL fold metallo-hydrolase [Bacillota bacterium]
MLKRITSSIYLVEDPYRAKPPRCHCLYVEDDLRVLIDSSSGPEIVNAIGPRGVDLLLTTHFHMDHILNHNYFSGAEIWVHSLDAPGVRSQRKYIELLGFMKFGQEDLGQEYVRLMNIQGCPVTGEFVDGQVFNAGKTRIEVVHLPGHSAGHCGFYFPQHDILYSADIDLTRRGPWYGGVSSDIDVFIASIRRIKDMQPSVIISSHLGIITDRIPERLENYVDQIYLKEERLLQALKTPQTLDDMVNKHLFHQEAPRQLIDFYNFFEKAWISVHLERLERLSLIKREEQLYYCT